VALLVTLACHAVPAPLRAADEASPEPERSSATLPLDEILQLYRERDEATRKEGPPPLVAASLQKVALSGRLLDDGIDFEGHFEISVLTDDEWVQVPLFAHDAGTHLTRLPDVKGGAFAVRDGELVFLTRKRGRYAFDLSLFRTAGKQDRMRRLSIGHGEAALATCRLDIDGGLFRLRTERSVETRDGVRVLAGDDGFEIEWEVIGEIESGVGEAVSAPAIESVVSRVHASTVSTLKGRRITRILYELRFARSLSSSRPPAPAKRGEPSSWCSRTPATASTSRETCASSCLRPPGPSTSSSTRCICRASSTTAGPGAAWSRRSRHPPRASAIGCRCRAGPSTCTRS
jgi:hypothetical protein